MKILAISDTFLDFNEIKPIIKGLKPDVIVLAGDYDEFLPMYEQSKNYHSMIKNKFIDFLKGAGMYSKVVLTRGNHEEPEFSSNEYYDEEQIKCIHGCIEISDHTATILDTIFLGIGYSKTYRNASLIPLLNKYTGTKIDVIVTHCDISKLPHIARVRPRLIIRGHAANGPSRYLVNGVPVISSGAAKYSIINLAKNNMKIKQVRKDEETTDKEWFSAHPKKWLAPWI